MRTFPTAAAAFAILTLSAAAQAAPAAAVPAAPASCAGLPGHDALRDALTAVRKADNGGLNNEMWGVVTARDGTVCAVAITGANASAQWPGSRLIAAAKANTANAFSLDGYALSTANLYAGAQPGGYLFGIAAAHPINEAAAYKGPASSFGTAADPLVGAVSGGAITFGGGLPLYSAQGKIVGGLGVSGDTSCADHNIAWRTRNTLMLDTVPNGPSKAHNDQIVYDLGLTGKSSSGFGQPACGNREEDVAKTLPDTRKPAAPTPAQ